MLNRKPRCVIICRIRKLYGEGIRILNKKADFCKCLSRDLKKKGKDTSEKNISKKEGSCMDCRNSRDDSSIWLFYRKSAGSGIFRHDLLSPLFD